MKTYLLTTIFSILSLLNTGCKFGSTKQVGALGSNFEGINTFGTQSTGKFLIKWIPQESQNDITFNYEIYISSDSKYTQLLANQPGSTLASTALIEPTKVLYQGMDLSASGDSPVKVSAGGSFTEFEYNFVKGTTYVIQVKSVSSAGVSVAGASVILIKPAKGITTPKDPPKFDGITTANVMNATRVYLSWNAATPVEGTTYNIYSLPKNELIASTTETFYKLGGLTSGTTYNFTVRAANSEGTEDTNTVKKSVTTLSYTSPDFLGLESVSQISGAEGLTKLKLSWQASGGLVTGYRIFKSTTSGGQDYTLSTAGEGAVLTDVVAGPYTSGQYTSTVNIPSLTIGTKYCFVVRAFYSSGSTIVEEKNTIEKCGTTNTLDGTIGSPTVTAISPKYSATTGGGTATLTGTNFIQGSSISLAGIPCTSVSIISTSSATCTIGASGSSTVGNVVFTSPVSSGSLTNGFAYSNLTGPSISSISPTAGPIAGGTTITFTGTNFSATSSITINGVACSSFTFTSATSVSCVAPAASAGAATVVLQNPDLQSSSSTYTYQVAPAISDINPKVSYTGGGVTVTLTGSNFVTGMGVSIGGASCGSVNVSTSSSATCQTGSSTAGANLTVTVTNADAQTGSLPSIFTYSAVLNPTISTVVPGAGATGGGTVVTVSGNNFTSGLAIRFGSSTCTLVGGSLNTSSTPNTVRCTSPVGSGTVNVTLTNPDTQAYTKSNGFTYTTAAAPSVQSISPIAGASAGGTSVTITGNDFVSPVVTIGGATCNVASSTSGSITCTTAAGSGPSDIVVTNTDTQIGTLASGYNYTSNAAPTLSSVSPAYGTVSGGATVTLTGTGFVSGASLGVKIGTLTCTSPSVVSSTSATCVTPASGFVAGQVYNVTLTNGDGQAVTRTSGFTVLGTMTATGVTPAGGTFNGGTTITIAGSGFAPENVSVAIGGTNCGSVIVSSSNQITCVTAAKAVGLYNVVVTNPDSTTSTITNGFSYVLAPHINTVTPFDNVASGDTLTIIGGNFTTADTVAVGGQLRACG